MPFDGVPWGQPVLVPPLAYHPHAPLTAEVLSAGFVNAYYSARRNGRKVLEQSSPLYGRSSIGGAGAPEQWHTALSFAAVLDGYAHVDGTFTHAKAFVIFEAVTTIDALAYHRLRAHDGSTTNTGAVIEQPVATNGEYSGSPRSRVVRRLSAEETNDGFFGSYAEVALAGLALDTRLRLTLEGYSGSLGNAFYRFRWAAIYLECRQ